MSKAKSKAVNATQIYPHDDYRAQEDASTLQRAQEIQSDKQRHGAAVTHAKKKVESLQKLIGGAKKPAAKSKPSAGKGKSK